MKKKDKKKEKNTRIDNINLGFPSITGLGSAHHGGAGESVAVLAGMLLSYCEH